MTRRPTTVEEVHKELARRLGREPHVVIWQQVCSDPTEWVQGVIDGDFEISDVLRAYRSQQAFAEAMRHSESDLTPRKRVTRRLPADRAIEAEAKIAAIEAADLPEVRSFRDRVLGGQLLGWQEAHDWLNRRYAERRKWTRIHLPDIGIRATCARVSPWEARTAVTQYAAGGHLEGGNQADTELDYLYCLCDLLTHAYRWDDENESVALYVLTGVPPARSGGRLDYAPPPVGVDLRNGTVTIQISARLGPRELMDLYSQYRAGLLGEDVRVRAVSEAAAALAVFIAAANDGRSWSRAMRDWNRQHADEGYYEPRLFSRDCRAAYRRVMGRELGWRRATTERPGPRGPQPEAAVFEEINEALWSRIKERERIDEERTAARKRRAAEATRHKAQEEDA